MGPVLVLIDIQRDYFPGGRFPLVDPDAAAERAAELLVAFRAAGLPVVHVRHESSGSGSFLEAGTPGAEIDPRVAPEGDETVVVKHHPNAFWGGLLGEALAAHAGAPLVVAGMMTSMCVDASVRAASDLGWEVTVAADACAAPDLAFGGVTVGGADVHAAFLAALASAYARVEPVAAVVAALRAPA
ncbi:cysteine hydrolase family protein [Microbacterium sp. ET2]|uniref:cysteine hydrolase family protein n=1 Tax=Microbacterium albipurpureum TaxID=3050384 RepID=UPI00259CBCE7|nr:cysteine hydrolase family protein [Microbacterium sp. ET2 (Ac-2212)]WJL94345.1 cysteine hydrolase family protein [Microbacterium sp. ET2 (Ac-2212)]